jgi:antitoxin ParD1/3/4
MYMTMRKSRLTVTVDAELVAAGNAAVERGTADSLSGWVNEALVARAERDRKLDAMTDAITAYEAEFGEITEAEMAAQNRADRAGAIVVRGDEPRRSR